MDVCMLSLQPVWRVKVHDYLKKLFIGVNKYIK